ncbi:MAG: hypothetical protein ACKO7P_00035 [Bacteroidota bacterium]
MFIIFVLSTLIVQSLFVSPQMDDYSWFYVKEIYANDSFWTSQLYFFTNVNGRIIATLISSILMSRELLASYNFIVLILNVSFVLALTYLIKHFVKTKTNRIYVTTIFILVFLALIKQPQSFFYWLSGMVVYQISTVFIIISLLLYLKIISKKGTKLDFVILIIVSNSAILLFEFSFFVLIIALSIIFWLNNEKTVYNWITLILVIILLLSFFLINLNAPGNFIKTLQYGTSRAYDWSAALNYVMNYFMLIIATKNILILSAWILFLFFMPIHFNERKNSISQSFLLMIISFGFILSINFLYFYRLGVPTPDRVENFNLFWFLISFSIGFIFLKPTLKQNLKNYKPLSAAHFLFAGILVLYSYNFRLVLSDLVRGRSYNYTQQIKTRVQNIDACNEEICYVKPIINPPKTIIYVELPSDSLDANEFYSRQQAAFYKKKWIFQQVIK